MTYQILTSDSPGELEGKVNAELYKGWQLQGGVSVNEDSYIDPYGNLQGGSVYAQAMTKE